MGGVWWFRLVPMGRFIQILLSFYPQVGLTLQGSTTYFFIHYLRARVVRVWFETVFRSML